VGRCEAKKVRRGKEVGRRKWEKGKWEGGKDRRWRKKKVGKSRTE
jgi:hypothetical protein